MAAADKPEIVETPAKSDIDFKLATIRRDCLSIAIQANKDKPIELADQMFKFVTKGEMPTGGWK